MKLFFLLITILHSSFSFAQYSVPNFTMTDIKGVEKSLYEQLDNNKIVVINFFSTTCGSCITGVPYMESAFQTYETEMQKVVFWGIETRQATNEEVEQFCTENNASYTCFSTLNQEEVLTLYDINYTPQYWVIIPEGKVKQVGVQGISTLLNDILSASSEDKKEEDVVLNYSNSKFVIQLPNSKKSIFEIYDVSGKMIFSKEISSKNQTIETSNLKKGIYIARITQENKKIFKKKIVVL